MLGQLVGAVGMMDSLGRSAEVCVARTSSGSLPDVGLGVGTVP